MTFISYAQNFEDVMLWRALKHVPNGIYIDVGAQDPIIDSVSKAFYEHGWRGIHVEPVPRYADMLRRDRPDETVLQLALSDQAGILELNVFEDTGLSTGVKEFADSHRTQHGLGHRTIATPMLPMRDAFASLAGQSVHWLKIDVEGFEEAVLRGWDSEALRPWIIVIEATVPMSTELRYQGAEDILLAARYEFVYFDGLNRFYLAAEHPELKTAFSSPPNVFDDVRLSGFASSELCRGLLEAHHAETSTLRENIKALEAHHTETSTLRENIKALRKEAHRAEILAQKRIRDIEAQALHRVQAASAAAEAASADAQCAAQLAALQLNEAQQRLNAVLDSTSWRVTAPMRSVSALSRRLLFAVREGRLKTGLKRRIKLALRACAHFIVKRPTLKLVTLASLRLVPPLRRRLRIMLAPPPIPDPGWMPPPHAPGAPDALSPNASIVYRQLKQNQNRLENA